MSDKNILSLHTLPVELVYRILDHLDTFTILFSMQNVCKRLNTIANTYDRYTRLTYLQYFPKYGISSKYITNLANTLQYNTTITTVILKWIGLDCTMAKYLANTLQKNTALRELDLSINKIGENGANYFANALRKNTTLTTLNLSTNRIGSTGARHLANALEYNTTLMKLNLSENGIDQEGAQYLANALEHNTMVILIYSLNNESMIPKIFEKVLKIDSSRVIF